MNINATLIGQAIWFALFIWITMKYVWPPLQKAMADRQAQIADGLAAAERGKHEQELRRLEKHSGSTKSRFQSSLAPTHSLLTRSTGKIQSA